MTLKGSLSSHAATQVTTLSRRLLELGEAVGPTKKSYSMYACLYIYTYTYTKTYTYTYTKTYKYTYIYIYTHIYIIYILTYINLYNTHNHENGEFANKHLENDQQ